MYVVCQSGSWVSPTSGKSGLWEFHLLGYINVGGLNDWFYGTGYYNSSAGLFSGTLVCEFSKCGTAGLVWCGADPSCAWSNGVYYWGINPQGYNYSNIIYVVNVPVQTTSVNHLW